jgi:hypothetical protein
LEEGLTILIELIAERTGDLICQKSLRQPADKIPALIDRAAINSAFFQHAECAIE